MHCMHLWMNGKIQIRRLTPLGCTIHVNNSSWMNMQKIQAFWRCVLSTTMLLEYCERSQIVLRNVRNCYRYTWTRYGTHLPGKSDASVEECCQCLLTTKSSCVCVCMVFLSLRILINEHFMVLVMQILCDFTRGSFSHIGRRGLCLCTGAHD